MRTIRVAAVFAVLLAFALASAAEPPFRVEVQPADLSGMPALPGLHSFASAKMDGYWVFVGGRLDGNHFDGPQFAWDKANRNIWVFHLATKRIWQIAPPPSPLDHILGAANAQADFHEKRGKLYILGGYGASRKNPDSAAFITYPYLVSLDVRKLVRILGRQYPGSPGQTIQVPNTVLRNTLRSRKDGRVALAGGRLEHNPDEDRYYLLFGQNCTGLYCAGGQQYSFEVRSFRLFDGPNGVPTIAGYRAVTSHAVPAVPPGCAETLSHTDSGVRVEKQGEKTRVELPDGKVFEFVETGDRDSQFRRRDLNAGPIRIPGNGSQSRAGVAAYGGVFTRTGGIFGYAYLNPIYVAPGSAPVIDPFEQKLSHYETALLPAYDPAAGDMHTVFFGGLSLYVYENGAFRCDVAIPYIDTISVLSRRRNGASEQTVQPARLPDLLGTNAVFLPVSGSLYFDNGVLDLGRLPRGQGTLVGWIYGGIKGSNQGGTTASNALLEVRVVRD